MKRLVRKSEIYDGFYSNNDYIEVFKNPTADEIVEVQKEGDFGSINGIIYDSGNYCIWAGTVDHNEINNFLYKKIDLSGFKFGYDGATKTWNIDANGESIENTKNLITQYKSILNKVGDIGAKVYITNAKDGYDFDYKVAKQKDRGQDGKPINHMETKTKGQTNFAHRLLHMWWNNPEKTDWTKQQIIDEHKKVVDIMKNEKHMNHNMKDGLDDTLPTNLKSKEKVARLVKKAVYLHCHNCGWDNGDFMYNDDGTLQGWVPKPDTKKFKEMDKAQIYKTEKEFNEKNPDRKCPKCGEQELDMD